MRLKTFENYEEINLDVHYELRKMDRHGDMEEEIEYENGDDDNTNPYSLEDMVQLYIKYKKKNPSLFIKKITEEILSNDDIEKVIINMTGNKYNL